MTVAFGEVTGNSPGTYYHTPSILPRITRRDYTNAALFTLSGTAVPEPSAAAWRGVRWAGARRCVAVAPPCASSLTGSAQSLCTFVAHSPLKFVPRTYPTRSPICRRVERHVDQIRPGKKQVLRRGFRADKSIALLQRLDRAFVRRSTLGVPGAVPTRVQPTSPQGPRPPGRAPLLRPRPLSSTNNPLMIGSSGSAAAMISCMASG